MKKILIVGGGIGGLTAAIALRRVGADVSLVERSPAFSQVGAGITVQANANAVFQAMGVHIHPEDSISIGPFKMINGRGQILMSGDAANFPVDYASLNVHRADLHKNLLHFAEGIPLRTGISVDGLKVLDDEVEVRLSDGSEERWDVVIGADGLHSTVRRELLGQKECSVRYSGQTCWRFACDAEGHVPDITIERWRPGQRTGVVPLSRDRVYVYMVQSAPQGTPEPGSAKPSLLKERFGGWHEGVDTILSLLDDDVPIHHGDLMEHTRTHFGHGRVVLLGDAAHAMTPNLGQGAGMAIEDAATLALLWKKQAVDLAEALAIERLKRVEKVKTTSWRLGSVAHWQSGMARWFRDLLLRSIPPSVSDKQGLAMWQPGFDLAKRLQRELS